MFDGYKHRLTGGVQPTRITVQCSIGEGTIATIMQDTSTAYEDVSVGSYPWFKPGQFGTAVVLTGLDRERVEQAAAELAERVSDAGYGAEITRPAS